jgi:hypothetical protein
MRIGLLHWYREQVAANNLNFTLKRGQVQIFIIYSVSSWLLQQSFKESTSFSHYSTTTHQKWLFGLFLSCALMNISSEHRNDCTGSSYSHCCDSQTWSQILRHYLSTSSLEFWRIEAVFLLRPHSAWNRVKFLTLVNERLIRNSFKTFQESMSFICQMKFLNV